jgi:hypothetical protein
MMSEKIEELAKIAWEYADRHSQDGDGKFGHLHRDKFAELIIDECLNIIDAASGVGDDDVIQIERDIARHFGRDTTDADNYLKSVNRE